MGQKWELEVLIQLKQITMISHSPGQVHVTITNMTNLTSTYDESQETICETQSINEKWKPASPSCCDICSVEYLYQKLTVN